MFMYRIILESIFITYIIMYIYVYKTVLIYMFI